MKNRLVIMVLLLVVVAGVGLGLRAYLDARFDVTRMTYVLTDKDRAEAAAKLYGKSSAAAVTTVPAPLKQSLRLAIGGLGFAEDQQNGRLADLLLTELASARGLELIDRQSLNAILQETHLSLSGLVRAKDAVKVGKLLRADWFLLGTIAKVHGTNSLVLRIVDARTGIMDDAAMLTGGGATPGTAKQAADFIRQSRLAATEAKPRVYLAIGALEDLSVNSRQADFPAQLLGYLAAAYRKSNVVLLERENVEILLQEMRLDLAGLTEGSTSNVSPPPLQSAFWLLDGSYQSYETSKQEVEVSLQVRRIFGTGKRKTLRALSGDPVCAEIKKAVDIFMNEETGYIIPSRLTEASAQMALGRQLSQLDKSPVARQGLLIDLNTSTYGMSQEKIRREKRNREQAIKAFETVLLLEPTNRIAKMHLALCLRHPLIMRDAEARNLYREMIEEPVQDAWSSSAKDELVNSFGWWRGDTPESRAKWFEAAEKQTSNSPAGQFYGEQARRAEMDSRLKRDAGWNSAGQAGLQNGDDPALQKIAEQRLFEDVRSANDVDHHKSGSRRSEMGLYDFVKAFGTNHALAARKTVELYPRLTNEAPDLAANLMLFVVTHQVETNVPIIKEFQREFARICERPREVFNSGQYWTDVSILYEWSVQHHMYELAVQAMQGRLHAAAAGLDFIRYDDNEDTVELAYAQLALGKDREAMDLFQSLSNRLVIMVRPGLWSKERKTMILPGREVAKCRQKLGLPEIKNPREFELSEGCFCFCSPSAFTTDEKGIWVGINGQLIQLDFELKTNFIVSLPMGSLTPIHVVKVTDGHVWVGTGGDGLIDFDRTSHKSRALTDKDGLMMNTISSLQIVNKTLWIGYGAGKDSGGGLGKMDLDTGRFAAFARSLTDEIEARRRTYSGGYAADSENKPTRYPVTAITGGKAGEIWFTAADTQSRLLRYNAIEDTWGGPARRVTRCAGLAQNSESLFVGGSLWSAKDPGPVGVHILNLKSGEWRSIRPFPDLPPEAVTALKLEEKNLWMGGRGYIALVDAEKEALRKYAFVPGERVDQIEIAGGYLWAKYANSLHRVLLSEVQR